MRHFISLVLIMLLTSCSGMMTNHYSETVKSWRGASAQKLVSKWGNPDKMMALKGGNTLYIYKSYGYRPDNGSGSADCTAMFEINKQQIIVHSQYEGKRCWRDQNFARSMSNNS